MFPNLEGTRHARPVEGEPPLKLAHIEELVLARELREDRVDRLLDVSFPQARPLATVAKQEELPCVRGEFLL